MIQSVGLSPAEVLLLQKGEDALRDATARAQAEFQQVVGAIFASHGFAASVQGSFQKDPLDPSTIRFVYDDGKNAG